MNHDDYDPFADDGSGAISQDAEPKKGRSKPKDLNTPFETRFEKEGWLIANVEKRHAPMKWDAKSGAMVQNGPATKEDLFGIADFIGIARWLKGITFIQVCRKGSIMDRFQKATTDDASNLKSVVRDRAGKTKQKIKNQNRILALKELLLAGNRYWIVGLEKAGSKWELTICDITLEVLQRKDQGERLTVAKLPKVDYRKIPKQEPLI